MIPNTKRVRCGWYIGAQGFDKHVNTTFPKFSTELINEYKKIILNWMYSSMKCICVSYLHYKYSRYLFMKYLYSPTVTNLFGVILSNNVSMFVQKHFLVHEKHFLFYHRNDIRHYGEYSNTLLEGTSVGFKHSSISTHPGLLMDSSMMILSVQSDKHGKKTHSKVFKHCERHCLNYRGEIHDKLTRMACSMMSNIIALVDRYWCIRVSEAE